MELRRTVLTCSKLQVSLRNDYIMTQPDMKKSLEVAFIDASTLHIWG